MMQYNIIHRHSTDSSHITKCSPEHGTTTIHWEKMTLSHTLKFGQWKKTPQSYIIPCNSASRRRYH